MISLVLGAILGLALQPFSDGPVLLWLRPTFLEPMGQVFLRLIFMVVVPMVFCGLFLGVYELASHHDLGAVVRSTLLWTVITSASSVFIGVSLVNFFEPGKFVTNAPSFLGPNTLIDKIKTQAAGSKTISQALVEIVPSNPLGAAVGALDGQMLSLMFFALMFGIAAAMLKQNEERPTSLVKLLQEIYAVSMKIVDYVLYLAPIAVFCLVFNNVNRAGLGVLQALAAYVAIVVVALFIQQFCVYGLLLKYGANLNPLKFFSDAREILLYAFATSSSNATLPRTLELAETRLKLHPEISRFVLTVGSTANQNGTALFEGVTVLFLAQVYGIHLSFGDQMVVAFLSILAGVGTAGVPGGSLPLILIVMQQVGIPVEGIGVVLGVDRFLDMCRTVVNVCGDLVIAAVVSRRHGHGPGAV